MVMDSTKLPLPTWFLAIFLISQHKTGLSSLALMCQLGTSYRTAWLIHHQLMATMAEHDSQHPLRVKISPLVSFTREAITHWARHNLLPGCDVRSDGLHCFAGVIDAGCTHADIVVGERKPRELPQFIWIRTALATSKPWSMARTSPSSSPSTSPTT